MELTILRRVLDKLCQYIQGDNRRHAKYATQILACCKKKEEYCSKLVEVMLSHDLIVQIKLNYTFCLDNYRRFIGSRAHTFGFSGCLTSGNC